MKKTPTTSDTDTGISRVAWSVVSIGVAATLIAFFVGGARTSLGVGLGALLAVSNLFVLAFLVRRLIAPERPSGQWAAAAALKLALLLIGIFLIWKSGAVAVIPLVIGYVALPLGIVVGQVLTPNPAPAEKES